MIAPNSIYPAVEVYTAAIFSLIALDDAVGSGNCHRAIINEYTASV